MCYLGIPSCSFSTIQEYERTDSEERENDEAEEDVASSSPLPPAFSPRLEDPFAPLDSYDAPPISLPPPLISDQSVAPPRLSPLLLAMPESLFPLQGSPRRPLSPPATPANAGNDNLLLSLFPNQTSSAAALKRETSGGGGGDNRAAGMIEMPPNSLETLEELTRALPVKRAPNQLRREMYNPWDNVPDQPLVRYRYHIAKYKTVMGIRIRFNADPDPISKNLPERKFIQY